MPPEFDDPDGIARALQSLPDAMARFGPVRQHLARFFAGYTFAIQEVETKVRILQQEFELLHRYNPIEHVTSRLKTPESVMHKARRLGCGPTTRDIRERILDIAGVRVVCSFTQDVYRVQEMLCSQTDITLLEVEDYMASPKPSGYRALHALIEVPVFLSDQTVRVPVEMQFRTVAQDFWAGLEHKIYYKYEKDIPAHLRDGLREAARTAAGLDAEMQRLAAEIHGIRAADEVDGPPVSDETLRDFLALLTAPADADAPPVDDTADRGADAG